MTGAERLVAELAPVDALLALDVQRLDNASLQRLLSLGAGVSKLLDIKNKVTVFVGRKGGHDPAKDAS